MAETLTGGPYLTGTLKKETECNDLSETVNIYLVCFLTSSSVMVDPPSIKWTTPFSALAACLVFPTSRAVVETGAF